MYLLSRSLANPGIAYGAWYDVGTKYELQLLDTGGSQGWVINSFVPAPAAHPNFPFGKAVEPD